MSNHPFDFDVIKVSILILLDYLFLYFLDDAADAVDYLCLNPYFIGLPILIVNKFDRIPYMPPSLNPYFIGLPILISERCEVNLGRKKVSILILLDYLFLYLALSYTFLSIFVSILILLDYLFL